MFQWTAHPLRERPGRAMLAIAAILVSWGFLLFALLVVLSASAYLRPGEARAARAEDAPADSEPPGASRLRRARRPIYSQLRLSKVYRAASGTVPVTSSMTNSTMSSSLRPA